jgi:translation initiation factor 2 subunit 1
MNNHKEFPEPDELVICIVKTIIKTSVFVKLDNYDKEGVISFSEVAPGRIRNIRDYVAPNKRIVCRVLRINREKGHIDLSLRRVSVKEQKEVLDNYNKEKSNSILLNLVVKDDSLIEKIKKEYGSVSDFFSELVKDEKIAKKFLKQEKIERLIKLIKEKEKERKVKVNLKIKIEHQGSQGIEIIKNVLNENKGAAELNYIGAPYYSITLKGKNYKEANKNIKEIADKIIHEIKSNGGKGEIVGDKK